MWSLLEQHADTIYHCGSLVHFGCNRRGFLTDGQQ